MLKIGEVVATFTLTAEDGKTISPSDFRVKKIVLYSYPKLTLRVAPKMGGAAPRVLAPASPLRSSDPQWLPWQREY